MFLANYPLCDASDCNNHGLCLGTKKTKVCACHLGYSGKNCEKGKLRLQLYTIQKQMYV